MAFEELFTTVQEFLFRTYFGTSIARIILFFAIVGIFAFLGKIFYFISKNYFRKAVEKTSSQLDDLVIKIVEKPLTLFLGIIGL
ncbi:MAG: hypothetical protein Q7K42_05755, partial [Candidatus Diapherotrites archaeon]|nr:hypothetical protein [Candidatus Diapherotrites archaeon]